MLVLVTYRHKLGYVLQKKIVDIISEGGHTVVPVEALRYEKEGRRFDSQWGRWDFFY